MAVTDKSGSSVLIQHTNNSGVTAVPKSYSIALTNSSMADKGALDDINILSGVMRDGVNSSTLVSWRALNTQSSGTPHKKGIRIWFFSRQTIPATAVAVGTAITLINTDAPYILGFVDIASGDWKDLSSTVAGCQGTVAIRIHSDDDTKGTSIYCLVTNNEGSSWTPSSGEKLEFDFNFELN